MISVIKSLSVSAAVLVCMGAASGQEKAPAAGVREMNNLVLRHHELATHASPLQAAGVRTQAAIDIEKREATLAALVATDPDAALSLAFPSDELQALRAAFPGSANHFERQGTFSGVLRTAIVDTLDLRGGTNMHWLVTANGRIPVHFSSSIGTPASGEINIEGIEVAGTIAARSFRTAKLVPHAVTAAATGAGTTGAEKIVTILVNLPAYTLPSNVTQDYMKGVLYGNSYSSSQSTPNWSVDDFWQQNSDGVASAPASSGQVVGPFLLTSNFNSDSTGAPYCDFVSMESAAINAADAAVNFLNFNRVVIVMPNNGACTWAGVSGIGYWQGTSKDGTFNASFHWLRADTLSSRATGVQLASHELGHGMGMNHARSRAYTSAPLGAINALGTVTEYGDPFDTMASWNFGFYNVMHAQEVLGWLGTSNYVQVTTPGQFAINSYETRNATSLVKALRVLRDAASNSWLWVEFRTNTGNYDSQIPSQAWSGALIHYEDANTGIYSDLLDFNPSTAAFTDAALSSGQTWQDPYSNLSLTIGSITPVSGGSTLGVTVNFGGSLCTTASPTVSISPSSFTMSPSSSAGLTVTVKSNNSSVCPVATYNVAATQPTGFTGTLSTTSVSLSGGSSASVTLTETSGPTTGTFALTAKAADAGNSANTGSATANITVATACVAANPTVTLSPASINMSAGGSQAFTVSLKNNNTASCSAASFSFSAVQPSGFSGTFSKTSVSSIASGATSSVTLTEKAGAAAGTFTLNVTGTNASNAALKGTGAATITIATCTLAAPSVTLSPSSVSLNSGSAANLTVSVKNLNSFSCADTTFTLSSVQPSGFTGKLSTSSLTIASGATATATLAENASRTSGTYLVTVSAVSGTYKGTGTASITVRTSTSGTAKITGRIE
jgi:hypothetical protein